MRPSLGWQARFLTGFIGGETAQAPPYTVSVDVTTCCNLHCLHCRRHSPATSDGKGGTGADFPLERFRSLCREARELGVAKIVLIGEGEPLLHPGIAEMVAAAKAAGCEVRMLTNGTLLSAGHADTFHHAGLDELQVSLWASSEEEYRVLYPGSPSSLFHQAVEGARCFNEARRALGNRTPRVVLHRPLEQRFFGSLEATLGLALKTGCDAVSFSPMKPLFPEDDERLLTPDQVRELTPLLRRVGGEAERAGLAHNAGVVLRRLEIGRAVWEKLPCYIGWVDVRVRVDGNVVPCDTCRWVLGNLNHAGLREIWNDDPYREFRRAGRRPDGVRSSGRECRCDYCCHAVTNDRLHRFLRLIPGRAAGGKGVPS